MTASAGPPGVRISVSDWSSGHMGGACALVRFSQDATVEEMIRTAALSNGLSAHERAICETSPGLQGWAGRVAAKVAVAQLLRQGGSRGRPADVEVRRDVRGRPIVLLTPAMEWYGRGGKSGLVEVTVSHVPGMAVALAYGHLTPGGRDRAGPTSRPR